MPVYEEGRQFYVSVLYVSACLPVDMPRRGLLSDVH